MFERGAGSPAPRGPGGVAPAAGGGSGGLPGAEPSVPDAGSCGGVCGSSGPASAYPSAASDAAALGGGAGSSASDAGAPSESRDDDPASEPPAEPSSEPRDDGDPPTEPTSDDEPAECRVCRGPSEPDAPLFYPCQCRGSIKFVHQSCLTEWLSVSGQTQCELCSTPFVFEPIYARGAPQRLPLSELVGELVGDRVAGALTLARPPAAGAVARAGNAALLGLVYPAACGALHRAFFARSWAGAAGALRVGFGPRAVLLAVACPFAVRLAQHLWTMASLTLGSHRRVVFARMLQRGGAPVRGLASAVTWFEDGEEVVVAVGGDGAGVGGRPGRPGDGGRPGRPEDEWGDDGGQPEDDGQPEDEWGDDDGQPEDEWGDDSAQSEDGEPEQKLDEPEQKLDEPEQKIDDEDDNDPLFASYRRALAELEGAVERLCDTVERARQQQAEAEEEEADEEEQQQPRRAFVVLERVVEGPGAVAAALALSTAERIARDAIEATRSAALTRRTAVGFTADCAALLACVQLAPFTLGRAALAAAAPGSGLHAAFEALRSDGGGGGGGGDHPYATLALGYVVLLPVALLALGGLCVLRPALMAPLAAAAAQGARGAARAAWAVGSWLLDLVLLPVVVGVIVDAAALPLFGATVAHRLTVFAAAPWISIFMRWVVGLGFVMGMGVLANQLGRVFRADVMVGGGAPADAEPPVPAFVDPGPGAAPAGAGRPWRRALEVAVFFPLGHAVAAAVLIAAPIYAGEALLPGTFPLQHTAPIDSDLALPVELVLLHVVIPFVSDRVPVAKGLHALVRAWLRALSAVVDVAPLLEDPDEILGWEGVEDWRVPLEAPEPEQEEEAEPEQEPEPEPEQEQDPNPGQDQDQDQDQDPNPNPNPQQRTDLAEAAVWLSGAALATGVSTAVLVAPLVVGRVAFAALLGTATAFDFQAYVMGVGLLWAAAAGAVALWRAARSGALGPAVRACASARYAALAATAAASVSVFPLLAGALFETVVVLPLCVWPDETPLMQPFMTWGIGLIFFKGFVTWSVLARRSRWGARFREVRDRGLRGFDARATWRDVVLPLFVSMADPVLVPLALGRAVPAARLWLPPAYTAARVAASGARRAGQMLKEYHDGVRDRKYLVGQRLRNTG